MSFLGRLLGRGEAETRSLSAQSMAALMSTHPGSRDRYISTTIAENLSGYTACIAAISSAMASLPLLAYRRTAGVRVELQAHWLPRLLRRPNGWQTGPDLIEFVMGDVLARGNALLLIETDGAGRPNALIPAPWSGVQVEMLANGRLVYTVSRPTAPWGMAETPRRYLDDQVFHLKDRSDDGLIGRSRVSRAPGVIQNAASLDDWNASMWRNAATPSGAIEIEANLSESSYKRLREQFENSFTGTHNARRVLILDNKARWQALSVSPEDAEVLNSRRFSIEELARLFGVPPPIIGDLTHGTFTNSETLIRFFAQGTLSSWCRKFEAEFARSVLGASNDDLEVQLDLSGLLRGDPAQRWATYAIAIDKGILDTDEVREIEGWNRRPVAAGAGGA